jgi:hypothetical protein
MLDTAPANGTLALNRDGSFIYTPDSGFSGTDGFSYKASDGMAHSDPAAVTIMVEEAPNSAPTAVNDNYTMQQEETLTVPAPGLLGNDTDPDGDPLTAAVEITPANGSVALNADGSFTYTPATGFFGTDTFTYQIVDGQGGTDTAVVTLTVNETIPTETYFVYMPFVKK